MPDPLASALQTARKALADIEGHKAVELTVAAVRAAGIDQIAVVSGDDVRPYVGEALWVEETGRQIPNARAGVHAVPDAQAVLFLPCDTAFLQPDGIRHYMQAVQERVIDPDQLWFSAGVCPKAAFDEAFPGWPHPAIRLKDGDFMSGAYFATSRDAFFHGAEMFETLAASRKSQLQMLWKLGPVPLIRYLTHRVTLAEAEDRLGKLFGGQAIIVPDCDPEAMADIDTVEDYRQVQRFAARYLPSGSSTLG